MMKELDGEWDGSSYVAILNKGCISVKSGYSVYVSDSVVWVIDVGDRCGVYIAYGIRLRLMININCVPPNNFRWF